MDRNAESIIGTDPALQPWQFYGPTTRRDGRLYLHLVMRPYDEVIVRGVPVNRVQRVRTLDGDGSLEYSTRTAVLDRLNADPTRELIVTIPESCLDPFATVVVVDFDRLD